MKPVTTISVFLLALLAVAQLVRFLAGWPVTINGLAAPVWLSAACNGGRPAGRAAVARIAAGMTRHCRAAKLGGCSAAHRHP